jgi:hypothetical protein
MQTSAASASIAHAHHNVKRLRDCELGIFQREPAPRTLAHEIERTSYWSRGRFDTILAKFAGKYN